MLLVSVVLPCFVVAVGGRAPVLRAAVALLLRASLDVSRLVAGRIVRVVVASERGRIVEVLGYEYADELVNRDDLVLIGAGDA